MAKLEDCLPNSCMAVYWDWQNVKATQKQIEALMDFVSRRGIIQSKTIYADWQQEHNRKIADLLYRIGFECLNVPACRGAKNRADKKLIEDCEKYILTNPAIDTVILISGDGDFKEMVNKLKCGGRKVIVISRDQHHTSVKLKRAANEFYFLNQISSDFVVLPLAA